MAKQHLKRLVMPKTWSLDRKEGTFVLRPYPAGVGMQLSMPLGVIVRDVLKLGRSMREVLYVLKEKEILVDGKRRKDPKFPVGLLDVISISTLQQHFRLVLDIQGMLSIIAIGATEAKQKICKIVSKQYLKKGKLQIGLMDGTCFLADGKQQYRVGDSLLLTVPELKVQHHIPLAKNSLVYLIGGKHPGVIGEVEEIAGDKIRCKVNKQVFQTERKFSVAVGTEKPLITIAGEKGTGR
ncbi:30S ribosomal protein S4e [Candidatus Woesearchaeota archaeon]|nr:30S ribosomal protein S4e [Candidatus Woesearchaeota archaeon]